MPSSEPLLRRCGQVGLQSGTELLAARGSHVVLGWLLGLSEGHRVTGAANDDWFHEIHRRDCAVLGCPINLWLAAPETDEPFKS